MMDGREWRSLLPFPTHCEAEGAVERLESAGYTVRRTGLFVQVCSYSQATVDDAERLLCSPR